MNREAAKRLRLRPLLWIVIGFLAALMAWSRPERAWKIVGIGIAVAMVAVIVGGRVLWRRIQDARRPDPQSTLHLKG